MSTPAAPARIDTSHIRSPRDPMTPEEREAVRAELREEAEAVQRYIAEHGDPRVEWAAMYADQDEDTAEPDAA